MPSSKPAFSFEFFPPKTSEGAAKLRATWKQLGIFKPQFFSVTYGAGGSTRERTLDTVLEIEAAGFEAAPHISCIGATRAEIGATLDRYRSNGMRHIVALRGDMPSGSMTLGDLHYASELVAFARERTGDHFRIDVACYPEYHPQAKNPQEDLLAFKHKIDAGANCGITQYFYNADSYFRFLDACRRVGVAVPVVPGIMPIGNYFQLERFSDMCGAEIPRWLRLKMESFRDDVQAIREFGLDVVSDMCARLLAGGAPGLHFYTMNRADLVSAIWGRLGLPGA
jgi:methylenetetrahydrofolate reductase (NADPH)